MIEQFLAAWLGLAPPAPDPQITALREDVTQLRHELAQQTAMLAEMEARRTAEARSRAASQARSNAELSALQAATRRKLAQ